MTNVRGERRKTYQISSMLLAEQLQRQPFSRLPGSYQDTGPIALERIAEGKDLRTIASDDC